MSLELQNAQINTLEQAVSLITDKLESMQDTIETRFSKVDEAMIAVIKLEIKTADQKSDIDELKGLCIQSQQDVIAVRSALDEYKLEQAKNQSRLLMVVVATLVSSIVIPLFMKSIGV